MMIAKTICAMKAVIPGLLLLTTLLSSTALAQDGNSNVKIYLTNGTTVEADDAKLTADGVWVIRGDVTTYLDRSHVKRIVKGLQTLSEYGVTFSTGLRTEGLTNFTRNFMGENGPAVYQTLFGREKALTKTQFETTPEYVSRLRGLLNNLNLTLGKKASDEMTFVFSDVQSSYSADAEAITFKKDLSHCELLIEDVGHFAKDVADAELGFSGGGISLSLRGIPIQTKSRSLGRAVGQTVLGVKFRYEKSQTDSLVLAMPSEIVRKFENGITFKTSKAKARHMVDQPSIAITGRILYPFVANEADYKRPSLDDPYETTYENRYIIFRPTVVRVFNRSTGEVFASLDLK